MTPISALQTDELFILKPHATAWAYGFLAFALAINCLLIYMGWTQHSGKKDWRKSKNKNDQIPIPYNPIFWLLAVVMLWAGIYRGFSWFYGFRIHPNEVELLYVWPKESIFVTRSNLLRAEIRLNRKQQGSFWVAVRGGKEFKSSMRLGYYDREAGQEALRRINGAVIQP